MNMSYLAKAPGGGAEKPAIRYGGVIQFDALSWAAVRDNVRQRDTESRARRAKHLRTLHPAHQKVNVARFPDGTLMKLDGHSRGFLWRAGEVPAPEIIYADVWECETLEDAKDLYTKFDSQDAVETSSDKIFGGLKECGVSFTSDLLRSQRFGAGLRYAQEQYGGQLSYNRHSVYRVLSNWLPELALLDECGPTRRRFIAPIVGGALLIFRRYGPEAKSFWAAYQQGAGVKLDGEMDAVQAFQERVDRLAREGRFWGSANRQLVLRTAISAYEAFREDRSYSTAASGIKAMGHKSFEKWMARTRKIARSERPDR